MPLDPEKPIYTLSGIVIDALILIVGWLGKDWWDSRKKKAEENEKKLADALQKKIDDNEKKLDVLEEELSQMKIELLERLLRMKNDNTTK